MTNQSVDDLLHQNLFLHEFCFVGDVAFDFFQIPGHQFTVPYTIVFPYASDKLHSQQLSQLNSKNWQQVKI